ncbi:MAG: aryl-sulfate sulfotransferase [Promethearchaeota archaeon]
MINKKSYKSNLFLLLIICSSLLSSVVIYQPFIGLKPNIFNFVDGINADQINPTNSLIGIQNVTNHGGAFEGYNLFILMKTEVGTLKRENYLLITDMEGNIKKQRNYVSLKPVEFLNSTTLMYGEWGACALWNIYDNSTEILDFVGHHEYEYNPINDTFFTFGLKGVIINNITYLFDIIYEYNRAGQVVWFLNTWSFINYTQWCPLHDLLMYKGKFIPDITHSNTLFFDIEEDVIYYNSRNVNTFYKINHTNKEVIWGLGEYGNFTLFDQHGNTKQNLFYHAHSIEKIDDNTFILFDNDFHNQTNPFNHRSRLLEITINETIMTANETWSWISPSNYYSSAFGDADRLPNKNRLGTFGTTFHGSDVNIGARLVEVDNTGQIVWEMNYPHINNNKFAVYRMERFHFSPILSSPKDLNIIENESISIKWNAWYNFRSKQKVNGSYILYLDSTPIKSGIHIFEKFWHSTNLTFSSDELESLKNLEPGIHNLALELADEAGHKTTDSVFLYNLHVNDTKNIIGYPLILFINFLSLTWLAFIYRLKKLKLKI